MIKQLRCKLSKAETGVKHGELTRVLDEKDSAEADFAEVKADHKQANKRLEDRVDALRRDLRSGTEERPVECEEVVDERRGTIEVKRTDTGETIDTRAMTMHERQTGLDFDKDEDEGKRDDDDPGRAGDVADSENSENDDDPDDPNDDAPDEQSYEDTPDDVPSGGGKG